MNIRQYQPGDETAQAAIYNAAAGRFPKFKPATVIEVQRRIRVRDFDPRLRFYAEVGGQIVGYGVVNRNGRVSFPWCLDGHESCREPLFAAMLSELRSRGAGAAFAAYRGDWPEVGDFFVQHGFRAAREIVNFFTPFHEMPTPSSVLPSAVSPVEPADVPRILALAPELFRGTSAAELEGRLFRNPYFPREALFAIRSRGDQAIAAVGLFVNDATYADPEKIDSGMPCYRLGAFGAEGMESKRVNGLFSFVARDDRSLNAYGLELIGEAANRVQDDDPIQGLAAQCPTDAPALLGFYSKYFRRQGSFPVYERAL